MAKGMSKEWAAEIADSSGSSRRGGEDSGGRPSTQKQKPGRDGGQEVRLAVGSFFRIGS